MPRSHRSTRRTEPDDVVVVSAAEEGIFAAYHALLEPGDHVVVETPCYESALQVALSAGAEVTEWRRSAADGWAHDLDALERALRPDTRLVYVNTPHNPTGTLMPRDVLDRVVELCAERGAWLFCDEVYRELEHDPADRLPAACDLYDRALSLGSMSKTYGLPGLRLGWLASRDRAALARIVDLKHYTTICSSAPSELLSALALRHREALADRNRGDRAREPAAARRVLRSACGALLVDAADASPIGFARVHGVEDTTGFCEQLVAEAGVLLLPGRRLRRAGSCPDRVRPREHARGARAARALDRHTFLTVRIRAAATRAARFPNILPIHHAADNTTPSRRGAAMGDGQRLTTWIEWYRFARHALELGHAEASAYATARYRRGAESHRRPRVESGMSGDPTLEAGCRPRRSRSARPIRPPGSSAGGSSS